MTKHNKLFEQLLKRRHGGVEGLVAVILVFVIQGGKAESKLALQGNNE